MSSLQGWFRVAWSPLNSNRYPPKIKETCPGLKSLKNLWFYFSLIIWPYDQGSHSPGKPGIWPKKIPCMEKSWNLKKRGHFHGKIMEFCFSYLHFFNIRRNFCGIYFLSLQVFLSYTDIWVLVVACAPNLLTWKQLMRIITIYKM